MASYASISTFAFPISHRSLGRNALTLNGRNGEAAPQHYVSSATVALGREDRWKIGLTPAAAAFIPVTARSPQRKLTILEQVRAFPLLEVDQKLFASAACVLLANKRLDRIINRHPIWTHRAGGGWRRSAASFQEQNYRAGFRNRRCPGCRCLSAAGPERFQYLRPRSCCAGFLV